MSRRASGRADGDLFAPDDWDRAPWVRVPQPDDPDGARTAAEDEARLIERLVARDERAFNSLVRAYERRVFALVLRMIGNRAEAEDLAQEVFVQVFKAIGSFRGDSKLSTWVYRIAINLCKNRSKYLRVRHAGQQDELEAVADHMPLGHGRGANVAQIDRPDEAMAGKQVEHIVQQAILQLEPSFRECLVLRDVEDLELRGDRRHHGPARGHRQEPHPPRASAAQGDRRARARREDPMTDPERPAHEDQQDAEEHAELADDDEVRALVRACPVARGADEGRRPICWAACSGASVAGRVGSSSPTAGAPGRPASATCSWRWSLCCWCCWPTTRSVRWTCAERSAATQRASTTVMLSGPPFSLRLRDEPATLRS